MKNYTPPALVEYGDIASITAVLGGAFDGDVLVDTTGQVEQTGNLSLNAGACTLPGQPTIPGLPPCPPLP